MQSVTILLYLMILLSALSYAQEQILNGGNSTNMEQVEVTLYYESLCPDSINFIRNELYPTWLNLKDKFNIQWIPYGKATHRRESPTSPYTFSCQHGPSECRGNMLQACGIDNIQSKDILMKWIHCLMSSPAPNTAGSICSRRFTVNHNPIVRCERNARGNSLLADYGDITHALKPRLTFVPTITFNGIYNSTLQNRALRDFRGIILELSGSSSNDK